MFVDDGVVDSDLFKRSEKLLIDEGGFESGSTPNRCLNNESVVDGVGVTNRVLLGDDGEANGDEDGFDSESKPYLLRNKESLVEGVNVVDGDNDELLGAAGAANGEIPLLDVDGNNVLLGRLVNGDITEGVDCGMG